MKVPISPALVALPAAESQRPEGRNSGKSGGLAGHCRDFEAIFLQSLFKSMRSTAIDGGLFEKGNDREIFQDLLDMEVARAAAASNSLGIGQILLQQLQEPEDSAELPPGGPGEGS